MVNSLDNVQNVSTHVMTLSTCQHDFCRLQAKGGADALKTESTLKAVMDRCQAKFRGEDKKCMTVRLRDFAAEVLKDPEYEEVDHLIRIVLDFSLSVS